MTVAETLCGWWIATRRPIHPDCPGCRQAPGGPDHQPDTTTAKGNRK